MKRKTLSEISKVEKWVDDSDHVMALKLARYVVVDWVGCHRRISIIGIRHNHTVRYPVGCLEGLEVGRLLGCRDGCLLGTPKGCLVG